MRDLNYQLKQLCKRNRDGSYSTEGNRARILNQIANQLQEMGYTQVKNLYGGIFDWVNHEQMVVDAEEKPTQRVHTYNQKWSKWLFRGEKVY